jgi:hypothetical protein
VGIYPATKDCFVIRNKDENISITVVKSDPGLGGGVAAPTEMNVEHRTSNIERPTSNEKQTSIAELGVAAHVFYPVPK